MTTSNCGFSPLLPVHPKKVYPVLVGVGNVIASDSTLYLISFASSFLPVLRLYLIVYSLVVYCALYMVSSLITSIDGFHPVNV